MSKGSGPQAVGVSSGGPCHTPTSPEEHRAERAPSTMSSHGCPSVLRDCPWTLSIPKSVHTSCKAAAHLFVSCAQPLHAAHHLQATETSRGDTKLCGMA